MNLFISSLLSGATLLLAELVGSRCLLQQTRLCVSRHRQHELNHALASTTSKPGAIVTST